LDIRAVATICLGQANHTLQRPGETAVVCGAVVPSEVGGDAAPAAELLRSQPSCIIVGHSVACAGMDFELVGEMTQIEMIASGSGVHERARLRRYYGVGRWRKLKGIARVRLVDETIRLAEIH
jgi:hypothetical protein